MKTSSSDVTPSSGQSRNSSFDSEGGFRGFGQPQEEQEDEVKMVTNRLCKHEYERDEIFRLMEESKRRIR